MPKSFEVSKTVDLAAKFTSSKNFPDEVLMVIEDFYSRVGQNLNVWVPKAPKLEKVEKLSLESESEQKLESISLENKNPVQEVE